LKEKQLIKEVNKMAEYKHNIDPINRIEGDLAVEITVNEHNKIKDAKCSGFVYRGFENIFKGQRPFDAMRLSTRSCGVCPVSHGTAGVYAIENATKDFKLPRNAEIVRDIVLGCNFVVSHATHFYFMWGPDLVHERYKTKSKLYEEIKKRFEPLKSEHLKKLLKEVRIPAHTIIAKFGGRFPHPNHTVPGGVTYFPKSSDIFEIKSILKGIIETVEKEVLNGFKLEDVLNVKSLNTLLELMKNEQFQNSDLGAFIQYALDIGLHTLGEGSPQKFISAGFGKRSDGSMLFKSGYLEKGKYHKLDPTHITEDTKYAYYETDKEWKHPREGVTKPEIRKEGAYSWIKAPRYFGHAVEAGPLARQMVNKNPLITELTNKFGTNTFTRTIARLYEIVAVLNELPKWVEELDVTKPFCSPIKELETGKGEGIVEAPRGIIGHWIDVQDGVIKNYQIITPTTWNCSPKDSNGEHSVCEQALIGVTLESKDSILEAGHIVRSFDPCISCSIHAIGNKKKTIRIEHTQ
jgi:uptake hydrogenase large subunit